MRESVPIIADLAHLIENSTRVTHCYKQGKILVIKWENDRESYNIAGNLVTHRGFSENNQEYMESQTATPILLATLNNISYLATHKPIARFLFKMLSPLVSMTTDLKDDNKIYFVTGAGIKEMNRRLSPIAFKKLSPLHQSNIQI